MTDLKQKLLKALAFKSLHPGQTVDVYDMGRADENARLKPLHEALVEFVDAHQWVGAESERQAAIAKCDMALAKIRALVDA